MISVRPPLSSVMSRSAATFTRSSIRLRDPPDPCGGDGIGLGGGCVGGPLRPGYGNGSGIGTRGPCGGGYEGPDCVPHGDVVPCVSMPIAYANTSVDRIIDLISRTVARLFVSLPSEMTTIAFFRCRPVCASGTAAATASYSEVAPRGRMRASPVAMRSLSVVQPSMSSG